MDILDNSEIGSESTTLTGVMKTYLTETAKWGKFIGIVGFVMVAFMVVAAFSIGTLFTQLSAQAGMEQFAAIGAMGGVFTFFYLVLAAIMFFPILYLYRFSTNMLRSLPSMDVSGIETSFSNLKSLFKFYGVLTLIMVIFYGIFIVIGIIAAIVTLL